MTTTSNIPVLDKANDQQHIEITSIELDKYKLGEREMLIQQKVGTGWSDMTVDVYRIDHHEVGYYIPSKVLPIKGKLHLMYYTNPDLPDAVRPFEDGVCYAWLIEWNPGRKYRYPALSRVFIDQIIVDGRAMSLFIASSLTYESLLSVPERKIQLDGDLAVYNKQHRWV